ncbi:hypothetical protein EGK70_005540 [Alcaligenes aquatilis]|uniref:hypothetical protein n=1 Tax=Alcaligenes aquatilis TaxID=323284 RepID=UPI000F68029F|nr:hypothetical protein [Alcaligenes aquatilis]QXR36979.1 hypothetical protein EGK70_005540 [Alcaligenes aquatilis]
MSEKKCSCNHQMCAALTAGAILTLVVGFVLGWAWDKRDGALSGVSILAALTALGTVGASLAAVVFPLRQYKKDKTSRLREEWVLSELAYRSVMLLEKAVNSYIKDSQLPTPRTIEHVIRQLEVANQAFVSPVGRLVIAGALDLSLEAEAVLDALPAPMTVLFGPGESVTVDAASRLKRSSNPVTSWRNSAKKLLVEAEKWQETLLKSFDELGERPGVIRKSLGSAQLRVRAKHSE